MRQDAVTWTATGRISESKCVSWRFLFKKAMCEGIAEGCSLCLYLGKPNASVSPLICSRLIPSGSKPMFLAAM